MTTVLQNKRLLKLLPIFILVFFACLFMSGCSPFTQERELAELEQEYVNNCWSCQIFSAVFSSIDMLISQVYYRIASGTQKLLMVILALWVAVHTGKFFLSFRQPDVQQYWTDFAKTFFAAMVCGAFLYESDKIFELISWTIAPIFQTFINLALTIASSGFTDGYGESVASCSSYMADMAEIDTSHALQDSVGEAFSCMIGKMNARVAYGVYYSYKFMAEGTVVFMLFGLIFWIVFSILNFIFPFYLIDGILKIGIALVLVPLFIAFWPFQILRPYVYAGIKIFLSTFFQILVMAIFIVLALEVMVQMTERLMGKYEEEGTLISLEELTAKMSGDPQYSSQAGSDAGLALTPEQLGNTVEVSGTIYERVCTDKDKCGYMSTTEHVNYPFAFLIVVFLGFYLIKMVGTTNKMAAQFAGARANTSMFGKAMAKLLRIGALIAAAGATTGILTARKAMKGNKPKQ